MEARRVYAKVFIGNLLVFKIFNQFCQFNIWMLFIFWKLQFQNNAAALEKKQKRIDQEIAQWKAKVDEVQAELEASQRDSRGYSTEVRTNNCIFHENEMISLL